MRVSERKLLADVPALLAAEATEAQALAMWRGAVDEFERKAEMHKSKPPGKGEAMSDWLRANARKLASLMIAVLTTIAAYSVARSALLALGRILQTVPVACPSSSTSRQTPI